MICIYVLKFPPRLPLSSSVLICPLLLAPDPIEPCQNLQDVSVCTSIGFFPPEEMVINLKGRLGNLDRISRMTKREQSLGPSLVFTEMRNVGSKERPGRISSLSLGDLRSGSPRDYCLSCAAATMPMHMFQCPNTTNATYMFRLVGFRFPLVDSELAAIAWPLPTNAAPTQGGKQTDAGGPTIASPFGRPGWSGGLDHLEPRCCYCCS